MPNDESIWHRFGSELAASAKEGARSALQQPFFDGFDEAFRIYIQLLETKIDALYEQMKEPGSLSEKQQFLLAHLVDLRAESGQAHSDYRAEKNGTE